MSFRVRLARRLAGRRVLGDHRISYEPKERMNRSLNRATAESYDQVQYRESRMHILFISMNFAGVDKNVLKNVPWSTCATGSVMTSFSRADPPNHLVPFQLFGREDWA